METITIRPGTDADAEAINSYTNHYIVNTHVTFRCNPSTVQERQQWLTQYSSSGKYRIFVACNANGTVVGNSCSNPWHADPAYSHSVETAVVLHPDYVGKGIGKKLYEALFEALEGEDVHRICAGINLPNDASLKLHEKLGFKRVGCYSEFGRKFERYWDLAWMEKQL